MWPISGTARADSPCSSIRGFRLNWRSWNTEDLSALLSLWLPPWQHGVVSPHLFQDDYCPRQPFTLKCFFFFLLCQKQIESFSCLMNILGSVKERSDSAEYGARGCFSHIHLFQFLMNWPTNHPFIFVNLQASILLQWPGADATKEAIPKQCQRPFGTKNNTLLKPDS